MSSKSKLQKLPLKSILFLVIAIFAVGVVNIQLIHGQTVEKNTAHLRASAYKAPPQEESSEPRSNLTVTGLKTKSSDPDGFFYTSKKTEVECTAKNNGDASSGKFSFIARTADQEIAKMYVKELGAGKSITIKGALIPKEKGQTVIACRVDIDKQVAESSEGDNSQIRTLYVIE